MLAEDNIGTGKEEGPAVAIEGEGGEGGEQITTGEEAELDVVNNLRSNARPEGT